MKNRRGLVLTAWAGSVVAAVATGLYFGHIAFSPPQVAEARLPMQTYTVIEGSVAQSRQYPVNAQWTRSEVGTGGASGMITTVSTSPGQLVDAGSELYSVGLRPVAIAVGDIPAFRDLAEGVDGRDVEQLQAFLKQRGHLSRTKRGVFDSATTTAVKKWQKVIKVPQDGVVRQGDLVFTPVLPIRIVLGDSIGVGKVIEPGSTVAYALAPAPEFSIVVSESSPQSPPIKGQEVKVEYEGIEWAGVVEAPITDQAPSDGDSPGVSSVSETRFPVRASDGGAICGEQCERVPVDDGGIDIGAVVIVIPETHGAVIPLSALGSEPSGQAFVVGSGGKRLRVTVLASDGGRAVVEGVAAGDVIGLFGEST